MLTDPGPAPRHDTALLHCLYAGCLLLDLVYLAALRTARRAAVRT
ncbi:MULTISPECIES: hypothetical protein [Streptomyces]|nr:MULTISPECIES: hypothetical protein [Streptomyces]GGS69671.1 hypothetical protein GCM10010206_34950 [Streptomyces cinerochromogenes]